MTRVNMVQVKFNENNNNINVYNNIYIFKYINNATRFLSCKMMMPRKLVWMDEKFM
jgi:hypothetical protein